MPKYPLSATIAIALILAAGSTAIAQTAAFGFDDHNGSPNSGTYFPGDSFTFSIGLTFTPGGNVANLDGLSYWFEQQNPSGPFNFSITNRDLSASTFNDPQTFNIVYPQNLSPQNPSDLGAISDNAGVGAGVYFIADLTVQIAGGAAPGVYQIENTTTNGKVSIITDDQGHTAPISQSGYTITIAPTNTVPDGGSAVALLGIGLAAIEGVRRRIGARKA